MSGGRRFEVDRVLGRGSFGTVYEARLLAPGSFTKRVALKLLHPEVAGDPEVVNRLRDEARLLGLVRHRALVKVDALVRLEGCWAVVMEHVEGVHLRRILQRGSLEPSLALEVVAEVAHALHVAYSQEGPDGRPLRLVHRDIKPSNLQLTPAGEVKLLDFGIARAEFHARECETDSALLGSLGYMAPERLSGEDGPASDVYALGVVLWEMLVGRRLGRTCTRSDRHEAFVEEALQEARRALAYRYLAVVELVGDMLSFEPARRLCGKEVERRCRRLRQAMAGPWLRDWCEGRVPSLMHDTGERDSLAGRLLAEAGADRPGEPEADDRTWGREEPWWRGVQGPQGLQPTGVVAGFAIGAALVVLAALGGATAAVMGGGEEAPLPVAEARESRVDRGLLAEAEAVLALAGVGDTPEGAPMEPVEEGSAPPASAPSSQQAASQPRLPAQEPPSDTAMVRITGDAGEVWLVEGGHAFEPGVVPAGTYALRARFPGGEPITAGHLEVRPGTVVTVRCLAAFTRCTVERIEGG